MSHKDKLFNFIFRLQLWAQIKLQREAMRDLPTIITAANSLVDYKFWIIIEQKKNKGKKKKVGSSKNNGRKKEGESS